MKIAIGFSVVILFLWFLGPLLFSAMKKHDYEMLYQGMQGGKRAAGAFVQEETGSRRSYASDYVHGRLRPEPVRGNQLTPEEKRHERKKKMMMSKW